MIMTSAPFGIRGLAFFFIIIGLHRSTSFLLQSQVTRVDQGCHFDAKYPSFRSQVCANLKDPNNAENIGDGSDSQLLEGNEETLMQIQLAIDDEHAGIDDVIPRLSKFTKSFPFAAVLPVQPLQYLPTDDGGVEVRFLRKKTEEKGSIDGGIRFYIEEQRGGIEITAKRNSAGQTVPKVFSEKLIVTAFVSRITEDMDVASFKGVTVASVFHRWM